MKMIEIEQLSNGAHRNQNINGATPKSFTVPDGWAVIPDTMVCDNFPFGTVDVAVYNGIPTVTKWTSLPVPEIEENKEAKIAKLKEQLSSTDYKVIKNYEAREAGKELPYDPEVLYDERQALRDQIAELEK